MTALRALVAFVALIACSPAPAQPTAVTVTPVAKVSETEAGAAPSPSPGPKRGIETKSVVRVVQLASEKWMTRHEGQCPSIDALVADGELSVDAKRGDEWGHPYRIQCTEDGSHALSAGPDGRLGTADDIVMPEANR